MMNRGMMFNLIEAGFTQFDPSEITYSLEKKEYFRWGGLLPLIVPQGSSIESTGGVGEDAWVSIGASSILQSGLFTERPAGIALTDVVNAKDYGAKGDGVADDTQAIKAALRNPERKPVVLPVGTYNVSETITIDRGQSLMGDSKIRRNSPWALGSVLNYIGEEKPRDTLILLGRNKVGAEPSLDSSGVVCTNIFIQCNKKIGFGVYGTYLTNDSYLDGITIVGSLEYNFYVARAWYATIINILSLNCQNNGIALGMPLVYSNGQEVIWNTPAPLELNQVKTDNIRSHSAGERFSISAPNTWKPTNPAHRMQGYGVGAGVGNAFRLTNLISERAGGVNLYDYTEGQPSKVIQYAYLENGCLNAGLDAATNKPQIIIDVSVSSDGGGHVLSDFFMNYGSGGIYTYKGNNTINKIVWLKRMHQPRFLKDIEGNIGVANPKTSLNFVHLEDVYYEAGYFNLLGKSWWFEKKDVNIRYGFNFEVPCGDTVDYFGVYIRRTSDNWYPYGSIGFKRQDGTIIYGALPTELPKGEWVYLRDIWNVIEVLKGGTGGANNQNLDFKFMRFPSSKGY